MWYARRRHIRPLGLIASALVLLVALPLLRPLRHPDPRQIADDERARLATVQAIVERGSLAIDTLVPRDLQGTIQIDEHRYSTQPPMLAAVLSVPYRIMHGYGLTMQRNPILVSYLLTVLGVTLPVALAAGILYRMGRLFELSRPWRMLLATGVIFCGGLISYATVLNAHAPAATLVLGSAACLLHLGTVKNPMQSGAWLAAAGFWAALAMAIEPTAGIFLVLFTAVIFALRWPISLRLGGVLLYLLGTAPPLLLHAVLTVPTYGSAVPREMILPQAHQVGPSVPTPALLHGPFTEPTAAPSEESIWLSVGRWTGRLLEALLGAHGLFCHFPVLILAILGAGVVMHRHWPGSTKTLAVVSLLGAGVVVMLTVFSRADWSSAMFASRWFIVFLPLLLFWSGAWVRRGHRPTSWALASVVILFSAGVSLVGAANPYPPAGFGSYTAAAAWRALVQPQPSQSPIAVPTSPVASSAP